MELKKPMYPERDLQKYPKALDEPLEERLARYGDKPLEPGQTLIHWAMNLPFTPPAVEPSPEVE